MRFFSLYNGHFFIVKSEYYGQKQARLCTFLSILYFFLTCSIGLKFKLRKCHFKCKILKSFFWYLQTSKMRLQSEILLQNWIYAQKAISVANQGLKSNKLSEKEILRTRSRIFFVTVKWRKLYIGFKNSTMFS